MDSSSVLTAGLKAASLVIAPRIYPGESAAGIVHGPAAGGERALPRLIARPRGARPQPPPLELQTIRSFICPFPRASAPGDRDRAAPALPGAVGRDRRRTAGGPSHPGSGPLLVSPRDAGNPGRGNRRGAAAFLNGSARRRVPCGRVALGHRGLRERAIPAALLSFWTARSLWLVLH